MSCGCTHDRELHDGQKYDCRVEGCGCFEFIENVEEWKREKERWDYEDAMATKAESEAFYQEQDEARQREEDWWSTDDDTSTRLVREDDAEDICEICGGDRHWCSCIDKYGD